MSMSRKSGSAVVAAAAGFATAAFVGIPAGSATATHSSTPAQSSISIRVGDRHIERGEPGRVLGNLAIRGPARGRGIDVTPRSRSGPPTDSSTATAGRRCTDGCEPFSSRSRIAGCTCSHGRPLAGATVDLRARPAHRPSRFRLVGTGTTQPDGSVAFAHAPRRTTAYRMVVHRSAGAPPGVSPLVWVHVRSPTSLSIRGRDVPDGFAVSGVLRGHATVIRGASVSLLSLAVDETTWTEVATARTRRHGKVRFVVPSSEGTSYRLSYGGSRRLAPSASGIVVD